MDMVEQITPSLKQNRKTLTLADRLWSQMTRMPNGCLEFQGGKDTWGYGRISRGPSKAEGRTGAHRAAWELTNGPIPDGLFVLHHCDNPPCCDVTHLFLGTHTDNMRDRAAKGRHPSQSVTHCPQGHLYDEANTRACATGRGCKRCHREKERIAQPLRRAARAAAALREVA